jgi:hypothetical protein
MLSDVKHFLAKDEFLTIEKHRLVEAPYRKEDCSRYHEERSGRNLERQNVHIWHCIGHYVFPKSSVENRTKDDAFTDQ